MGLLYKGEIKCQYFLYFQSRETIKKKSLSNLLYKKKLEEEQGADPDGIGTKT